MSATIRRRELVAAIGGAAVGWPLPAFTQQLPMPVVGIVISGKRGETAEADNALRSGLTEIGYIEAGDEPPGSA